MSFVRSDGGGSSFDQPPITGFWTWDIKRDVVHGDANLAEYFGFSLDEMARGAPIQEYVSNVHPVDQPRVADAIQRSVAERIPFRVRYRVNSRSLGMREILAIGRCYYDAEGAPLLFPGWFVDITDKNTAHGAGLKIAAHHVEQAKAVTGSLGQEFVELLLENVLLELQTLISRHDGAA